MTYHTRFTISTLFFFYVYRPHPDPPSFPTRRSSDLVIRPAIGKVQMELPTCTTGLVIPNAIGYWRQYESDRDMQISGQLAQMRAPPVLASGGWNVKQSSAADCRLYCGSPMRCTRSWKRGSDRKGSNLGSILR